jgi:HEPN domain-containing protein
MKPLTQEWVEKAEGDYRVASAQWQSEDPVWDAVCFHAEQCAEKYLKAWLAEHEIEFPKTHDLEVLAKLCMPSLGGVERLTDGLRFLTSHAVEIRYPGASAQKEGAEKCWQVGLEARRLVRAKLDLEMTP